MSSSKSNSIVFVTSDLYYVKGFLVNQIKEAAKSFDVCLVANADRSSVHEIFGDSIAFKNFNIQRKIAIVQDVYSFLSLLLFLIIYRPSIVHSTTPKAGLFSMVSAFLARVPFRLHTFTGQVWQTKRGFYRSFLKMLDRLTAVTSTHILCDSHSQREYLLQESVVRKNKSHVILNGSIRGVDPNKFRPRIDYRVEVRWEINIPDNSILILYMARFTRDKGALLMAQAFRELASKNSDTFLLMVGPDEEDLSAEISSLLIDCKSSYALLNYTDSPERYFAACDIFCLPSYREGFPMVLLNAASSAVPVVASRIYGSSDVVVENKTGMLFNPGDVNELVEKLARLSGDKDLIKDFGKNARAFAINNFSEGQITRELMDIYRKRAFPVNPGL